jgi:hypothetical protein
LSGEKRPNPDFQTRKSTLYLSITYKNSEELLTLQAVTPGCSIACFMGKWRFHAKKKTWKLFPGVMSTRPEKPYKSTV